jgi:hypothetical protein
MYKQEEISRALYKDSKVRLKLTVSCKVVVSGRPAATDLYKAFKSLIGKSKGCEASWVLSEEVMTFATRRPGEGIKYGEGGFVVSNIGLDERLFFKRFLAGLCERLKLDLAQE